VTTTPLGCGEASLSLADPLKIAYSIPEFLAACSLGRTFVYEEIKAGRLRAVKAGRRTLIEAAEGRRWLSALQRIAVPGGPCDGDGYLPSGAPASGAAS
jgi:hypothetical protein